uniref:Uncharacterized protein n=1 Tax=Glossina pallidipes TaxID=7398 RepID=A0A1A9ZTB4_GLOPL
MKIGYLGRANASLAQLVVGIPVNETISHSEQSRACLKLTLCKHRYTAIQTRNFFSTIFCYMLVITSFKVASILTSSMRIVLPFMCYDEKGAKVTRDCYKAFLIRLKERRDCRNIAQNKEDEMLYPMSPEPHMKSEEEQYSDPFVYIVWLADYEISK